MVGGVVTLPPVNSRPERWMAPLARTLYRLSRRVWGPPGAVALVGRSQPMEVLLERLAKAAPFSEPVLILGESGTGKELLAKALHLLSPRRSKPFVPVNCPQFQDGNLTVSELFGHKKGSFTGAVADRKGAFELADGGTLFLDEVADLHLTAQVMLLRTLATGEFQALGDSRVRRVDVRVIAATNRPLESLRLGDRFREDLYFRLRYFRLQVPPLRDRGEDWQDLTSFTLDALASKHGVEKGLSPKALELLAKHSWPGNVRELISVVTMGYAMAEGRIVEPEHFLELLGRIRAPAGEWRTKSFASFWKKGISGPWCTTRFSTGTSTAPRSSTSSAGVWPTREGPTRSFWRFSACRSETTSASWTFCGTTV
ncbi:MAG: sigma-54-dependent transcriptional regulator [Thermoanaerobaculum sp.]